MDNETLVLWDERVTQEKVFTYLEVLRKSGVTNMFGAGQYVARQFGVNKSRAGKMLVAWMASYK